MNRTVYSLSDIKNKLTIKGDYVELPHDDHTIEIWYQKDYSSRLKYFLDFNGVIVKSAYSLPPIVNKLNKLGLEVA